MREVYFQLGLIEKMSQLRAFLDALVYALLSFVSRLASGAFESPANTPPPPLLGRVIAGFSRGEKKVEKVEKRGGGGPRWVHRLFPCCREKARGVTSVRSGGDTGTASPIASQSLRSWLRNRSAVGFHFFIPRFARQLFRDSPDSYSAIRHTAGRLRSNGRSPTGVLTASMETEYHRNINPVRGGKEETPWAFLHLHLQTTPTLTTLHSHKEPNPCN